MLNKNTCRTFDLSVILSSILSGALSGQAMAQDQRPPHCMTVAGKIAPQAVSENCTSPVGICATGKFTGLLKQLDFVGTAVTNTDFSADTNVIVLTGNSVEQAKGGNLMTKDTIAYKTDGSNEFSEVDVIVGGTGAWGGATGTLQVTGTFPPTGVGSGRYRGRVCTP